MKLADGREVFCTLALPLPLTLVGALGEAIANAAEEVGYTDVDLLTDGSNRIVARRADGGRMTEPPTVRNHSVLVRKTAEQLRDERDALLAELDGCTDPDCGCHWAQHCQLDSVRWLLGEEDR